MGERILGILFLLFVSVAFPQDAAVSKFTSTNRASSSYAEAVRIASEFTQIDESINQLRSEVVRFNKEAVARLIGELLDGSEDFASSFDLSIFDADCTVSSAPEPSSVPSFETGWIVYPVCDDSEFSVIISFDSALLRMGYRLSRRNPNIEYMVNPLEGTNFAAIRELDPDTFPPRLLRELESRDR